MPPEILGLDGEDPKSADPFSVDMWCLGELAFQALTGHGTFEPIGRLIEYVKESLGFPVAALRQAKVSNDGIQFICSLMLPTPSQRLSAIQALNHPWMCFDQEDVPDNDSSSSQTGSRLEQHGLDELDAVSRASGEWTTEHVEKTTDRSSIETTAATISRGHVGSPGDPSANPIITRSNEHECLENADDHGEPINDTRTYSKVGPGNPSAHRIYWATSDGHIYFEDVDEYGKPINDTRTYFDSPEDPSANLTMDTSDEHAYMEEADEHGQSIEDTSVYVGTITPRGRKSPSNLERTETDMEQSGPRHFWAEGANLQLVRPIGTSPCPANDATVLRQNDEKQSRLSRKLDPENLFCIFYH